MRIALNLLYLIPGNVGGTQTYAVELMRALADIDAENEYLVFVNREAADLEIPQAPNFRRIVCPVRAARREARYAYEQFVLPRLLKRHKIDLVHSLGYVCPLRPPCASVVTIHDLNYIALTTAMARSKRLVLGWFVRQSARHADHILTLSQFSKTQMVQILGTDPAKITIALLGPHDLPPNHQSVPWEELERCYGLSRPYLLAFSSSSAHKNIPRLLQAYAQGGADLPHRLVLAGHLPEGGELHAEIERLGLCDRVLVTGYVPEAHVMPLLEHADLFVFPSWYEGFGLPVLDAQQAGTAVACSTAASLPEVAGEGAALFDPLDAADMARVLRECLSDPARRQELVGRGQANVQRFSWRKTASETLDVYRQVFRRRMENK